MHPEANRDCAQGLQALDGQAPRRLGAAAVKVRPQGHFQGVFLAFPLRRDLHINLDTQSLKYLFLTYSEEKVTWLATTDRKNFLFLLSSDTCCIFLAIIISLLYTTNTHI